MATHSEVAGTPPERADREGESQTLPVTTEVSQDVTPVLIERIATMCAFTGEAEVARRITAALEQRTRLGIRRYGKPLQTWNGRDATLDAFEEACDLAQYLAQRCLEHPDGPCYALNLCVAVGLVLDLQRDLMRGETGKARVLATAEPRED